jgi:iron complex transport system ATP-binding protein
VAYVPQATGLPLPFTVREFVLMGRFAWQRLFGSTGETDRRAADRALELAGMSAFADRTLGTLSGGELQKVLIAGALAQEAKLLLLDEPTTFLDPRYREEVRRLLAGLRREAGVALLTVTHDLEALAAQGGDVLALREGAAVFHGTAKDFLSPGTLRTVYGTDFVLVPHPETGALLPLASAGDSA